MKTSEFNKFCRIAQKNNRTNRPMENTNNHWSKSRIVFQHSLSLCKMTVAHNLI